MTMREPGHTSPRATLARVSATLLPIDVGRRPLDDHLGVAGADALERIRSARSVNTPGSGCPKNKPPITSPDREITGTAR